MNIFLWVLQVILALHTLMGAVWKFSNSSQSMPSLSAIPNWLWLTFSLFEILCCVGLVLPAFKKDFGPLVPIAAAGIAAEMFLFSGVHLFSGDSHYGPLFYWAIVAVTCGFIAYVRQTKLPIE